jgi:hypothetical protein
MEAILMAVAVVELLKQNLPKMHKALLQLLTVVLGVGCTFLLEGAVTRELFIQGVFQALTATGLYAVGSKMISRETPKQ